MYYGFDLSCVIPTRRQCLIGKLISANTMAPVRNNELTPVNIHTSEFTPKIEGKSYAQTKYFDNGIN